MAEVEPAPVQASTDTLTLEEWAAEQGISRAEVNHLCFVHQVERKDASTADHFAELLEQTRQARV